MFRRTVLRLAKDVEKQAASEAAALDASSLFVPGRPQPYPVTSPAIGIVAGPRLFHMADWVEGGKTCKEAHDEIDAKFECVWDREREKKKLELKFVREVLPQNSADVNNWMIQTCCPGYAGGEWNLNTVWGWKYDCYRAPWHLQGYLKSPNGTGDSGRNPGGPPFYGIIEWVKILTYEGWRMRRNTWRFLVAFTVTMIPVQFRDRIYDPLKEQGVDGYIKRRRDGTSSVSPWTPFVNSWGFPGWYAAK